MNSLELNEVLLQEAKRLGAELIGSARPGPVGWYWTSPTPGSPTILTDSESLYLGNSGIGLFLLELFVQSGERAYFAAAEQALAWALHYCDSQPTRFPAFISGNFSIVFLLGRFHEVTGEAGYLDQALQLSTIMLQAPPLTDAELLNGTAGSILCLLHLFAQSGNAALLRPLDDLVARVLAQACLGREGVYWDPSQKNIQGLCGLSHGASGVGFVLLELGNYFGNPAFNWLYQQAAAYEAQHFSAAHGNWADLRKENYNESTKAQFERAYAAGDQAFFTTPGYMNAWCHGAVGIGLTRLRAYELTGQESYRQEALRALDLTRMTTLVNHPQSDSLCHGSGGNAELFLEAYRVLKEPVYLAYAQQVAERVMATARERGSYSCGLDANEQEPGLFLGTAGIGYFFLRLRNPDQVASILLPTVRQPPVVLPEHTYASLQVPLPAVKARLLSNYFGTLPGYVAATWPERYAELDLAAGQQPASLLVYKWAQLFQAPAALWDEPMAAAAQARFHRAFQMLTHAQRMPSFTLTTFKHAQKMQASGAYHELSAQELSDCTLVLDEDYLLLEGADPTPLLVDAPEPPFKLVSGPCLVAPGLPASVEVPVNDLVFLVCQAFARPKTVQAVVGEVAGILEWNEPTASSPLEQALHQQIKELIRYGVLLNPQCHPHQAEALIQ